MPAIFDAPYFQNDAAAYAELERLLWPNGPVCPHCNGTDRVTVVGGKTARIGLKRCLACKKQFTVTVGTVFESSHIKLHLWFQAMHLMCSSKKGISSHQLHRVLGVTYKTAWFMSHRLREAMAVGHLGKSPLGGENKVVEADETYVGGKESNKHKSKRQPGMQGGKGKQAVVALVERDGHVRSTHVAVVNTKILRDILVTQASRKSHLMTDDSKVYPAIGREFKGHSSVNHSAEEYVKNGGFAHTNTVENYFSIFKRGVTGVYHHVSPQHLNRYLAEFDFRYNQRVALGVNDTMRTEAALKAIVGKRLTYRRTDEASI